MLVVVLAVASSVRWAAAQPGGIAGAWESLRHGGATAGFVRGGPPAGLEEADARLAAPVLASGSSTSYAFVESQTDATGMTVPVAWSPCRPIHFVVNVDRAPDDFVPTVGAVVREVSAATGLLFTFDGLSDEAPAPHREPYQVSRYGDQWAPVLVQFADESQIPGLAGSVAGLGGAASVLDPVAGAKVYVSGGLQLDVTLLDEPEIGGEPAYVAVLRHELGHVIGLQHVTDPGQLMFPTTGVEVRDYADGDLAGLALLGAGACAPGV